MRGLTDFERHVMLVPDEILLSEEEDAVAELLKERGLLWLDVWSDDLFEHETWRITTLGHLALQLDSAVRRLTT